MNVFTKIDPHEVGWHIGTSKWPRGAGDLWIRWERTTGVIGPQGSGKTLDALIPALLQAPGAALVTLTKPQDMLLSWTERAQRGPCVVADPFGLTKGLPEFVWDPIDGCVDPWIAERRAKAWTAGTIKGGAQSGQSDDAARFYANEAAKVLQCYLHAAALTGSDLDEVLEWVAQPLATSRPTDILRNHPHASPHWAGLLEGALRGEGRRQRAVLHRRLDAGPDGPDTVGMLDPPEDRVPDHRPGPVHPLLPATASFTVTSDDVTDGDGDRLTRVHDLGTADESVGGLHGDGADQVVTEVLCNLENNGLLD